MMDGTKNETPSFLATVVSQGHDCVPEHMRLWNARTEGSDMVDSWAGCLVFPKPPSSPCAPILKTVRLPYTNHSQIFFDPPPTVMKSKQT